MRNRTADPLLAKQVLSQLSYTPICVSVPSKLNNVSSAYAEKSDLGMLPRIISSLEVSLERR